MEKSSQHVILVDWMPYAFRAWLISPDGHVLHQINTQDGVFEVSHRQFGETLLSLCSAWIKRHDDAIIYAFGTIGTADGWIEVPNIKCPVSLSAILEGAVQPTTAFADVNTQLAKRCTTILPGAHYYGGNGEVGLMRTAAAAALGLGLHEGIICIPGPQTKWVEIKNSKIERFYAFSSFEMMGLLRRMFNVVHIHAPDTDHTLFDRGLKFAWRKNAMPPANKQAQGLLIRNIGMQEPDESVDYSPSILRMNAEIRHHIMLGNMHPRQLSGFLSGVVIGNEIADAWHLFGQPKHIYLIADGDDKIHYEHAITLKGARIDHCGFPQSLYQCLKYMQKHMQNNVVKDAPNGMFDPPVINSALSAQSNLPNIDNIFSARSNSGSGNIF